MPIENLPIPKYSDDELSVFHPYFRACFDEALRELFLEDDFALQGPFTTRSGQADFALVRIADSRVLLPIEIKRSPADLRLQGRRQARDYWNNIGPRREGPYFLATNLEIVELFKSDSQRAITESQLLETRLALVGKFATTRPSDFFLRLKASLCEILEIVVNGVVVPYVASIQGFAESLNAVKGEPVRWQQTQALFAFEYLRSALNEFDAYRPEVRTWSKAENYLNNLTRLHDLVSRIDFEPAFQDLEHPLSPALTVSSEALREAYLAGGNEGSGDDFSGVVNEILGNVPGLVETDTDLARLVAGFAKLNLNSDRNEDFKVLDAGAGAGALTIALKEFAFKSLKLSQIVAVEKEPRLKGILAIRLGLHFIDSLILNDRPNFHARKLEEIDPIDLQAVKLVITNPPFFSAVAMGSDMREIIEAIRGLGSNSELNVGQMPYEAFFLELITRLVPAGTTIVSIFPSQVLSRVSANSSALREFLLLRFGLRQIVIYPSEGLFHQVSKQTICLIGETQNPQLEIDVIRIKSNLATLDFQNFPKSRQELLDFTSDTTVDTHLHDVLLSKIAESWRLYISIHASHYATFESKITSLPTLPQVLNVQISRGKLANSGNTAFISERRPLNEVVAAKPAKWANFPSDWFTSALVNSHSVEIVLNAASLITAINPPVEAFAVSSPKNRILDNMVTLYLAGPRPSTGSQSRRRKTPLEVARNIQSDLEVHSGPLILVPRASRVMMGIHVIESTLIQISTNFLVITPKKSGDLWILSSWLLSIFGQLQLEWVGINQEGMRKIEMTQLKLVKVPTSVEFNQSELNELERLTRASTALDANNLAIRDIDELWYDKLFSNGNTPPLTDYLHLMQSLCEERRLGNA